MNNRLRQEYLDAIGVQNWQLKVTPDYLLSDQQSDQTNVATVISETFEHIDNDLYFSQEKPEDGVNPEQSIQEVIIAKTIDSETEVTNQIIPINNVSNNENNPELINSIQICRQCTHRNSRLNALVGQGNVNASVFIISEPPNAEEDCCGHYLTGSGQSLLNAMFNTIQLANDYYLTGILKCFSMDHFVLSKDEVDQCSRFLYQQIEIARPRVIVLLGAAQAQSLLKTHQTFNELRGKIHKVMINDIEYPAVVTYHPAYLIRNPLYKKQALEDLLRIQSLSQ